jgi:Cytochrome C oxidase, cbb3-type, subunit III
MRIAKIIISVVWILFGSILFINQGVSARGDKDNGKDLYKQNCKVCHDKDSPNGEFTPMSLTQDQWKSFFKNKFEAKHKDVILDREKKKLLEYLTTKQIELLQKFCVDHAADSEQPQTCSE